MSLGQVFFDPLKRIAHSNFVVFESRVVVEVEEVESSLIPRVREASAIEGGDSNKQTVSFILNDAISAHARALLPVDIKFWDLLAEARSKPANAVHAIALPGPKPLVAVKFSPPIVIVIMIAE